MHKGLDQCLACCLLCRDIKGRSEILAEICAILWLAQWLCGCLVARLKACSLSRSAACFGRMNSNSWLGILLQSFVMNLQLHSKLDPYVLASFDVFAEEADAVSDVAPEKVANQVEEAGQQAQGQPLLLTHKSPFSQDR